MRKIGIKTIEDILAKLDEVDTIKGSMSTGAIPKYLSKDESLAISELTEGGFAKDIYLYKDYESETVMIDYTLYGIFLLGDEGEFNRDIHDIIDLSKEVWFIKQGQANNPWREVTNPAEEMIIFNNGRWWIIDKIENGNVIPLKIAQIIDTKVASQVSSTTLEVYGDDRFINTKEFADKIKEVGNYSYHQSFLSKWEQDGLTHIMINTAIKPNYYLYNRTDNNIVITVYLNFTGDIELKDEAIKGFNRWSKTYIDDSEYVELGGQTVNLEVIINEHENGIPVNVIYDKEKTTYGEVGDNEWKSLNEWNINDVGEMELTKGIGKVDYPKYFEFVATHELGHVMGLGDAYGNNSFQYLDEEIPKNSVMFGREALKVEKNYIITANDIEMLQYANIMCKKQFFHQDNELIGNANKSIGVTEGGPKHE